MEDTVISHFRWKAMVLCFCMKPHNFSPIPTKTTPYTAEILSLTAETHSEPGEESCQQ